MGRRPGTLLRPARRRGRRPGGRRDVYYGYLAAKAGIHVIDVSQIDGNVRKVMDRCAAAPSITVPRAFRQALGRRG
jgi:hypothetical protein